MIYQKKGIYEILAHLNQYTTPIYISNLTAELRENNIGYAPYGRHKAKLAELGLIEFSFLSGKPSVAITPKGIKILDFLTQIREILGEDEEETD